MGKKDIFYDLRQVTNLLWQWTATRRKLNLSRTCFNSSEGQENSDSLAKNNIVRDAFRKFGAVCEASRICCIIYIKSKHSFKHCIYSESWLNNKTEKVWHLLVNRKGIPRVMLLLLVIMFYTIAFVCRRHVDPNVFPYVLRTHAISLNMHQWNTQFSKNNLFLSLIIYFSDFVWIYVRHSRGIDHIIFFLIIRYS